MTEEFDDTVERLEAAVKASDAEPEDLGIVNKTEYEETQDEIESLREENSDLEEENDTLREKIETVKELYAESLAEATGLDADFFMDKDLEDLEDLHEEKVDEDLVDTPSPQSGDVPEENGGNPGGDEGKQKILEELNAQFEDENLSVYPRQVEIEDEDDLKEIIETFENRDDALWEAAAEPYREALEDLKAA